MWILSHLTDKETNTGRENNLPKVTVLVNGSTGIQTWRSDHPFTAVNSNFPMATWITQKCTRQRDKTWSTMSTQTAAILQTSLNLTFHIQRHCARLFWINCHSSSGKRNVVQWKKHVLESEIHQLKFLLHHLTSLSPCAAYHPELLWASVSSSIKWASSLMGLLKGWRVYIYMEINK